MEGTGKPGPTLVHSSFTFAPAFSSTVAGDCAFPSAILTSRGQGRNSQRERTLRFDSWAELSFSLCFFSLADQSERAGAGGTVFVPLVFLLAFLHGLSTLSCIWCVVIQESTQRKPLRVCSRCVLSFLDWMYINWSAWIRYSFGPPPLF